MTIAGLVISISLCLSVVLFVARLALTLVSSGTRRQTEQRWLDDFRDGQRLGPYHLLGNMRVYTSPYGTHERLTKDLDEDVLLGPVSAWVAEGEAQAVRDWETKLKAADPHSELHELINRPTATGGIVLGLGVQFKPTEPDCDNCEWVDNTALNHTARTFVRGMPCAKHRPQPDLPNPMRKPEWR